MKQIKQFFMLFFVVSLISSCAEFGLEKPETVKQKLDYSYVTLSSVRNSAADALNSGNLSKDDARRVLIVTDQARELLDSANVLNSSGDTKTAASKLVLASGILTQIQQYLIKHR